MKTVNTTVRGLLICILLFIILNPIAFAEPTGQLILKGKVIDSTENTPLPFATVVLFNSDSVFVSGAVTNAEGSFQFTKLNAGTYKVVTKFVGYETKAIGSVILQANQTTDLGNVLLSSSTSMINEVTVVKRREQVENRADKKVVNITSGGITDGGVVADALVQVPSVTLDANHNVLLRGSSQFKVMIDGVPSPLDGNEALKGIPLSSIEKVEVITNPSSAFDSEGTAGIINIILKKEKQARISAQATANLSSNGSRGETINLSGQTQKLGYNFSLDDRLEKENADALISSQIFPSVQTETLASKYANKMNMQTLKADASYQINSSNSIQGLMWVIDATSNRSTSDENASGQFSVSGKLNSARYTNVFMPQLKFNHKFRKEGSATTIFAQYNQGSENSEQEVQSNNANPFRVNMDIPFKFLMLREDFTFVLNEKFSFFSGIDYKYSGFDYLYDYRVLQAGNWLKDGEKSAESSFKSDILAGYAQLKGTISGVNFTAGLRGEYTYRTLNDKQGTELYNYRQTSLFPSLLVSRSFAGQSSLTFSYSRRLNRPRLFQLNPFRNYTNPGIITYGNYGLKPEFQNTLELSYSGNMRKLNLNGTLYGKFTKNTIIQISENEQDNLLLTYSNARLDQQLGAELSLGWNPATWLSANLSANAFNYRLQATPGATRKSDFQAESSLNVTINPMKTLTIQSQSTIKSKAITAQGYSKGYFTTDLAVSKSIWGNKLRASLKATDLFNGVKEVEVIETSTTNWSRQYKPDSRQISLSLIFNINKFTRKNTLSPESTPY